MKIGEIEAFVKSRKRDQIDASINVIEKLKDRNLDSERVKDVILGNDVCGIVHQGEQIYEFSFLYDKDKDLNVALKIKGEKCYIATAYPRDTERRVRHGKTKRERVTKS